MGHTEFLAGEPDHLFGSARDAVVMLEDLSTIFVRRWGLRDIRRAGAVSEQAMQCFEFIVGELLRARDDRTAAGTYANSAFERALAAPAGHMVRPVTAAVQRAVCDAGPGNGALPRGQPETIRLEVTLNKLKHRGGRLINFRIEGDRHILLVCPTRLGGGGADSVVEFDVADFCRLCHAALDALSPGNQAGVPA
ncbi:MAG: hypothetical protein JWR80_8912 [Bradyrhizobium sp.]|nr:hypothetical protein [Bradyrhizobium sp.]